MIASLQQQAAVNNSAAKMSAGQCCVGSPLPREQRHGWRRCGYSKRHTKLPRRGYVIKMDYMNTDRGDLRNWPPRRSDASAFAALNRADITHEPARRRAPPWARIATIAALGVALASVLVLMMGR